MLTLDEMIALGGLKDDIQKEMYGCFLYFWNEAQTDQTKAFGLVRDDQLNTGKSSIAAVGFALAAIPVAVGKGWITWEAGERRASGTLKTMSLLTHVNGFFFHFLDMETGHACQGSEVSIIDTALFICGSIVAASYFGGETARLNDILFERIDWRFYLNAENELFYMGYWQDKGFSGYWDHYAEQLVLYVLGAAASGNRVIPKSVYNKFNRLRGANKDRKFIHTWGGQLFTYQYSHAYIDFRSIVDADGTDWFDNSVQASKAQYNFSLENADKFKSFSEGGWGVTACDTKDGYRALGIPPSALGDTMHEFEGTVAPSAALGSIVFTPEESLLALNHFMTVEGLWGEYGLKDAYNRDEDWVSAKYIGINKGITLLMLANCENETVWKLFMQNESIKTGLSRLEFREVLKAE